MQLNQEEIEKTVTRYQSFITLCNEYKELCKINGLPVSVDTVGLTTMYKANLFEKILAVDKGLKMRYDMLRSDSARLDLITEIINISGHDAFEALTEKVQQVEREYLAITIGVSRLYQLVTFQRFADLFNMELETVLETYKMNWEGKDHVLAYFQQLVPILSELRDMMRVCRYTDFSLTDTVAILPSLFTNTSNRGDIVLSDHVVMCLAMNLESKGKLSEFNPKPVVK